MGAGEREGKGEEGREKARHRKIDRQTKNIGLKLKTYPGNRKKV